MPFEPIGGKRKTIFAPIVFQLKQNANSMSETNYLVLTFTSFLLCKKIKIMTPTL